MVATRRDKGADVIGIMTTGDKMPKGFPLATPQNSGNMVHARAPFEMFPNTVGSEWGWKAEGYRTFADFVNDRCEALIVPFANSIRLDDATDAAAAAHVRTLSKFDVPIIVFGIGAQAPTSNIDGFELGPGRREFVKFLSERAAAVSVRGDFTEQVFAKYGSTDRVYNTGCPSFYSHPEAFQKLKDRLESGSDFSRAAFAGSLHHLEEPKQHLYKALEEDLYLIEPVSAAMHQFYLECVDDIDGLRPAYFFGALLKQPTWNLERLREYMVRRYRLFRDMDSWLAFNEESIDGTIGSRFHVNMASLLSGVPATWVVHDSRTQELCDRLALPNVPQDVLSQRPLREQIASADFQPMFDSLGANFDYFNEFLGAAGLPEIAKPEVV